METIFAHSNLEDRETQEILNIVTSHPALEIEWLDMLSQLEYVGCRKIVKAISYSDMSVEILRHLSEEASHAYLLKALVERAGKRRRSWGEGLFARAGWDYFQRLDRFISTLQENSSLNYPAVSWAIERRVLVLYPAYINQTRNESVKKVLSRILAQEKRHGSQFHTSPFPTWFRDRITEIEHNLWLEFKRQIALILKAEDATHTEVPLIH